MYPFGAIVLARFPFTDLSGDKLRPALVVSGRPAGDDIIVCFITSVISARQTFASIEADASTGLKRPSAVRFDKITTLNVSVIAGRLGDASRTWLDAHADQFRSAFGFRS